MAEEYVRRLLSEIRHQILMVPDIPEKATAISELDRLQQAVYRITVETKRIADEEFKPKSVPERARAALLEMGSTSRQADAIVLQLTNRGILDATVRTE